MSKSITELKNKHKDEDIYVLGSGPSLNYIKPNFFKNKIIIGVNQIFLLFKCNYIVRKENRFLKESLNSGLPVIVSKHDCGTLRNKINIVEHENLYYFDHLDNKHTAVDLSVIGTDKIVVSFSTITSAIHIAAYMGAANIILVGHDCCSIDGATSVSGYLNKEATAPGYKNWLKVIEPQTVRVKKKLMEIYGCNIVSINPFVSLRLEGKKIE